MKQEKYHEKLRKKMDEYVHLVYKLTKKFPQEERYGVTSQIRRAALSIILNYIEGYARRKHAVHKNSLEISYGSLKEAEYLLQFAFDEGYVSKSDCDIAAKLEDEIGAMLWSTIKSMKPETVK